MNKCSKEEEERLLEELLRSRVDSKLQPPPDGFEQAWRQSRKDHKKRFWNKRRAVELILIAALCAAIAVSAAPADLRERILNLYLQHGNQSSRVSLTVDTEWSGDHELTYLPDGYGTPQESRLQSLRTLTYTKPTGETIVFREAESVTAANIDNEELDAAKEVAVNENKGYLTIKDQTISLVWSEAQRYYVLDIVDASGSISEATAIRIAESVQAVSKAQ